MSCSLSGSTWNLQSSQMTDSYPDSCSPCKPQPLSVVATAELSLIGLFLWVRNGYTQHPHFEGRTSSANRFPSSFHSHTVSKGRRPNLKHHVSIHCSSIFHSWSPASCLSWGSTVWLTDNAWKRFVGKSCAKNKGPPGLLGTSGYKGITILMA